MKEMGNGVATVSPKELLREVGNKESVIMAKISKERKALYYGGRVLIIIGILMFISVFFTVGRNVFSSDPFIGFGDDPFGGANKVFDNFKVAIAGMIIAVIGSVVQSIGAKGKAGSGLILDPEQAREDLKPYSHMAGGMINDAMDEIDNLDILKQGNVKEVIRIKCRSCGALNEEDATYCKSCGQKV